jgi:hypothetical protein
MPTVPPETVRSQIEASSSTSSTLAAPPPSIASSSAPGPAIATFLFTSTGPLVRASVPVGSKQIVSPPTAAAIAARSDPGPLSFRLVTSRYCAVRGATGGGTLSSGPAPHSFSTRTR